jgi:hypothetical protein
VLSTVCPFCFRRIDSSRLAHQCSGRGIADCKKEEDEARRRLTGSRQRTYPTFILPGGQNDSVVCPICGGPAMRQACPQCHTALPIDFVNSRSPMVGIVGAKGSGKTVLMTVLIKQLREVIGQRFGADIRIATANPDGHQGLSDYQNSREVPLYVKRTLPASTAQLGSSPARQQATPIVLRWRQESVRRIGARSLRTTMLSFFDTAGEDLNDLETTFTLQYVSVCDALIVTLDPFALPGARARLSLPEAAIQVEDDVPLDVISRITELLRTEGRVKATKRISRPVAIVFTKIDAFYPTLDRHSPIMATSSRLPAYDNVDGQAVHEHMRALLYLWNAADIDTHMRLNYSDYRYFGVSALGAEPDYPSYRVASGGVQPHRVEDPVLWLLSKSGTVPTA